MVAAPNQQLHPPLSVSVWFYLSVMSSFLFSSDEEHVEGALTLALPKFVQMGFIVPDVTKTLEEERVEEVQRMGKIKDKRTRERERDGTTRNKVFLTRERRRRRRLGFAEKGRTFLKVEKDFLFVDLFSAAASILAKRFLASTN